MIKGTLHLVENVHPCLFRLRKGNLHDLLGNALDLDIHLKGCHAGLTTRDFEIHITEMIFISQDIRQYRKSCAVFN